MKRFPATTSTRLPLRVLAAALLAGAALVAAGAGTATAGVYDTSTALSVSPITTATGNTVTFTATVTGSSAPTGTIYFWKVTSTGQTMFASAPLVAASATTSTATYSTSTFGAGSYSVQAAYGPDDASPLNPSTSPLTAFTVGQKVVHTTSTTLAATPGTYATGIPETFTATVVTTDGSGIVPTGTVAFDDNGVPLGSALLDANGVATISGITGFVQGTNVVTASYKGNGIDTLVSSTSLSLVVPNTTASSIQTITTVSTNPQVIETGDTVTIAARVVQSGGQTPVKGNDVVTFTANGVPLGTAPIDANGYATITHMGWVAGTYDIEASYAGNSVYLYDRSQADVTLSVVEPASRTATALFLGGDTTDRYGDTAFLTATLAAGTTPIAQEQVTLTLGTQSCTGTTDANGRAACTIPLTQAPGPYTVTASFAGDTNYKPTSATGSFTITKAPTTITVGASPNGGTTALTALLTNGAQPLAGRHVTLTLGAVSCTAVTDAGGNATCPVATPPGTSATAAASFAGDDDYLPSGASTTVQLTIPTQLAYTGATSAAYDDAAAPAATLVDATGAPVANQQVSFTLGTQSCSATTDAQGVARCAIAAIAQSAGPLTVTASYAGDGIHLASAASSPFTVLHEDTTVALVTHGPVLASGSTALSGLLLEDGATPIEGRTLTLTLGPASCTGVTNALGVATCTVDAGALNGPVTTTATFAGDDAYASSTATGSALLYAYAPGGGMFVVGDLSDTGAVTYWGAQWWKANTLSGGNAPSSFKGYAKSVGIVAAGGSWSTDPGNSSPPPPAPLPAYMAVIVTSASSKSGAQISGDIVHVVIVKTTGDYDANPGHAGTGTVVATVF